MEGEGQMYIARGKWEKMLIEAGFWYLGVQSQGFARMGEESLNFPGAGLGPGFWNRVESSPG